MTTIAAHSRVWEKQTALRRGAWLMSVAAIGFIGYAVIFFIMNFTDQFLELGIGPIYLAVLIFVVGAALALRGLLGSRP